MVTIQIYPSKLQTLVSSTLAFPPPLSLSLSLSLSPLFCGTKSLQNPQKRDPGSMEFRKNWRNARNEMPQITSPRSNSLSLSLSIVRIDRFFQITRAYEEMAWARSDRRFTRVINRSSYIAPSKNLGETPNQTFRDSRLFLSVFFFFFFFWSLVAVIHRGTIWIKIWKTDGPFKRRDDFYYFYEGRGFIIETVLTRYKRLEMWSIILVSIKKKNVHGFIYWF